MRSVESRLAKIEASLPTLPPSKCEGCGLHHSDTIEGFKARISGEDVCSCEACGCGELLAIAESRRRAVERDMVDFED